MSAETSQRCRVLLRKSYTIFTRVLCSFILLPPPPPQSRGYDTCNVRVV